MTFFLGCIARGLGATSASAAQDHDAATRAHPASHIVVWASDPVIIDGLHAESPL